MPFWISGGAKKVSDYRLSNEQLKGLLTRYDTNGDGKLSQEELRAAFKDLGLRFSGWRAARALRHADSNSDGYVNEDEMPQLVSFAKKWGFYAS